MKSFTWATGVVVAGVRVTIGGISMRDGSWMTTEDPEKGQSSAA